MCQYNHICIPLLQSIDINEKSKGVKVLTQKHPSYFIRKVSNGLYNNNYLVMFTRPLIHTIASDSITAISTVACAVVRSVIVLTIRVDGAIRTFFALVNICNIMQIGIA